MFSHNHNKRVKYQEHWLLSKFVYLIWKINNDYFEPWCALNEGAAILSQKLRVLAPNLIFFLKVQNAKINYTPY